MVVRRHIFPTVISAPISHTLGPRAMSSFSRLTLVLVLSLSGGAVLGCTLPNRLQRESVGDLGYFELREPSQNMTGIVIGAPHGSTEPDTIDYASWISEQTGAGSVTAFGFKKRRLAVAQPLVRSISYGTLSDDPVRRGSIYPEFKKLLHRTARGPFKLYVGIRFLPPESHMDRIEVATSGFSFEQLQDIKSSYLTIRDRVLGGEPIPKIAMAMDPLDTILWGISGVKHHGVLMSAERGLTVRLPQTLTNLEAKQFYREVLSRWVLEAIRLVQEDSATLPRLEVKLMEHGRLERIPSRKELRGIVLGAPHGTFDQYTAEIVKEISFQTGLPAVIARGFTPTEGSGWRINVNRPTERRYPSGEIEIDTERARKVYQSFQQLVFSAAAQHLDLYVDVHQNGRQQNIEVATVGISREQALRIKNRYHEIRDRVLRGRPDIETVDLAIEPIDSVEIGAWAAKASGILGVAKKSLHFELPAHRVLQSSKSREAYTQILATLLDRTAAETPPGKGHAGPTASYTPLPVSVPSLGHLRKEVPENKARE